MGGCPGPLFTHVRPESALAMAADVGRPHWLTHTLPPSAHRGDNLWLSVIFYRSEPGLDHTTRLYQNGRRACYH